MWQFDIVKKGGFERSAAQIGRIIKTFSTQLVGENQKSQKQGLYRALPREDRYLAENGPIIGIMGHVRALFALLHISYKRESRGQGSQRLISLYFV